jgi:hypothetical protein
MDSMGHPPLVRTRLRKNSIEQPPLVKTKRSKNPMEHPPLFETRRSEPSLEQRHGVGILNSLNELEIILRRHLPGHAGDNGSKRALVDEANKILRLLCSRQILELEGVEELPGILREASPLVSAH